MNGEGFAFFHWFASFYRRNAWLSPSEWHGVNCPSCMANWKDLQRGLKDERSSKK